MSPQQHLGARCWDALKASLPGLIGYTANGFILSSAVPRWGCGCQDPAVMLPLSIPIPLQSHFSRCCWC